MERYRLCRGIPSLLIAGAWTFVFKYLALPEAKAIGHLSGFLPVMGNNLLQAGAPHCPTDDGGNGAVS